MLNWLAENIGTILISLGLLAIVAAIVLHMVHQKRQGKTSCTCDCANCPSHGHCH